MTQKIAIILQNLGGPDSLEAVRPFLFRLFSDKAIIRLPFLFRYFLAWVIAKKRDKKAQAIYQLMGGKSPILSQTQGQAQALEKRLAQSNKDSKKEYSVFIAMRYWHPFTSQTVQEVRAYNPDEILLLPLYPQYSTTTTRSSYDIWQKEWKKQAHPAVIKAVCCYHLHPLFIQAHVALITQTLERFQPTDLSTMRLLFSAHGLPQRVIDAGDPYQMQIEQTCAAIVASLEIKKLDYVICYQSKVGRLAWIGPTTDQEIIKAAKEDKSILIVPVAFVSEHSETLVELDIEYAHLAAEYGAKIYHRVPALGSSPLFIDALKQICEDLVDKPAGTVCECQTGVQNCGYLCGQCPINISARQ